MKNWIAYLTRIICCIIAFGLFFTTAHGATLHYVKVGVPLTQLEGLSEEAWKPFKDQIYNGLDNGIYWIRIKIDSDWSDKAVLSVPNSHITAAELYHNDRPIEPLDNYRYIGFDLDSVRIGDQFYLKVNCEKEATIPIKIVSLDEHLRSVDFKHLVFAAYYGFILAVILFNLNFFFHYRDDTYLYYLFLMVAVNIPPAIKDGIFYWLVPPDIVANYIEPLSHILCGLTAVLFTYRYLDLTEFKRQFFKTTGSIVTIGLVLFITFILSKNFLLYVVLDLSVILLLTICVGFGIAQFRKSPFARFFTIAYFPLLIAAYDSYICASLGIEFLQLSLDQYRFGTGLELLVFTVAIGYKGRVVAQENRRMRKELKEYTERLVEQHKGINESKATVADLLEHFVLTLREIDVLKAIAKDKTYKEIAESLFVSENTIKFHARNIFSKLKVKNRQDASQKYLHFPSKK